MPSRRVFEERILAKVNQRSGDMASISSLILDAPDALSISAGDIIPAVSGGELVGSSASTLRNYILGISGGIVNIPEPSVFGSTVTMRDLVTIHESTTASPRVNWPAPFSTTRFLLSTSGGDALAFIRGDNGDTSGATIVLARTGNTDPSVLALVAQFDTLGVLQFRGAVSATTTGIGADISATVSGAPSATSLPTDLIFSTTPSGALVRTRRWRVNSDGHFVGDVDNTYDIGQSGTVRPRDLFLGRNATIGGTMTIAGTTTMNGNVVLGNATSDTITATGRFASDLIPSTTGTRSIGTNTGPLRWLNAWFSGTVTAGTFSGNLAHTFVTYTGLTTGQVWRATSATAASFGALDLANANAVTGTLPNARTTATNLNTASTIVARDASGNFTAGTITAALIGNVTGDVSGNAGTVTNGVYTTGSYSDPSWITALAWSKLTGVPSTLGNVFGPASSTDNAVVLFDGATGKLIKNSIVLINAGAVSGITTLGASGTITHTGAQANLTQSATTASTIVGSGTGSGQSELRVRGAAGQLRDITFDSGTVGRWTLRVESTAESGSDAGSNLQLISRTDAGTFLRTDLQIMRATGNWTTGGSLTVSGNIQPNATDTRTLGTSTLGFVELWIAHNSSRASGLNLIQTLTGQGSPRLMFNNTTDWAGSANVIYQIGANQLAFTTGGTVGSSSGTTRWTYNATSIAPNTTNSMQLGASTLLWSTVWTQTMRAVGEAQIGDTAGFGAIRLVSAAGSLADMRWLSGTTADSGQRWILRKNTATESGSNAGSNLELLSRADDGSALRTDLSIVRSTGSWTIAGSVALSSTLDVTNTSTFRNDAIFNRSTTQYGRMGGTSWHDAVAIWTNLTYNHTTAVDAASSYTYTRDATVNNVAGSLLLMRGNGTETGLSLTYYTFPTSTGAGTVPTTMTQRFRVTSTTLTHNGTDAIIVQSGTSSVVHVGTGSGSSTTEVRLQAAAGQVAYQTFRTGTTLRWAIGRSSNAETGSNAGSDFALWSYDDAGAFIDTVVSVARVSGGTLQMNRNFLQVATSASLVQSSTSATVNLGTGTGSGSTGLGLRSAAGQVAGIVWYSGASTARWNLFKDGSAESGSDAGSALVLNAYTDAGASLGSVLSIVRAAGGAATWSRTNVFPAATASIPSIRLPHGTAPTTPTDGDVWTTTAGLFARINGVTASLSGSNTGDQTITLTGDVTGSGTGSFAATIANDAVTYAKMQNVSAASRLLGRGSAAGAGDVEELTIGTGLSLSGTVLSSTVTGDVVGPASATDNAVVRFDLATGKLLQNSGVLIDDSNNVTGIVGLTIGGAFAGATTGAFSSNVTVGGTLGVTGSAAFGAASLGTSKFSASYGANGVAGVATENFAFTITNPNGSSYSVLELAQTGVASGRLAIGLTTLVGTVGLGVSSNYNGFVVGPLATGTFTTATSAWLAINATSFIINDGGADSDTRIEGDTLSHAFLLDAGQDSLGLFGAAVPNFQSGRGIAHIANATTLPTADPTGGGFLYAEGGNLRWRSSSGVITTVGDGYVVLTKTANQDVTNAGLTNDTTFSFATAAGGTYLVELELIVSGNDTTGDITMDFTVDAGTQKGRGNCQNLTAADAIQNIIVTAAAAASTTAIVTGTPADLNTPIAVRVIYAFQCTNATTFRFRFGNAAALAGRTSRVWKGSVMRYKNIT